MARLNEKGTIDHFQFLPFLTNLLTKLNYGPQVVLFIFPFDFMNILDSFLLYVNITADAASYEAQGMNGSFHRQ